MSIVLCIHFLVEFRRCSNNLAFISAALTKLTPLAGATAASTSSIHTFPGELEELQSVLHFPEEVALRITDAEYQLFYQVNIQQKLFKLSISLSHIR